MLMIGVFLAVGLIVGVFSAVAAYLANRRRPDVAIRETVDRIVTWLTLATFTLALAGCAFILGKGCAPQEAACDMPAMAAAGVMWIGAIALVAVLAFGIPVSYVTLKLLRSK